MSLVLGIDTGGTSTDAALLDATGQVLATAKVPTQRAHPETSILAALKAVAAGHKPHAIAAVALSTTLATNALVEGHGAEVGLIAIGAPRDLRLPAALTCVVGGGHKARGVEQQPLDLQGLVSGIQAMRGHVDAYAVAALLAFVDPSHEEVAARAIRLIDPNKPIFCSHQASGRPGLRERAATALANARLLPLMERFMARIQEAIAEFLPAAAILLVRGDATAMSFLEARHHAAATAASGPAATALWGATHCPEALVLDVGGTTTDIVLVTNGRPHIAAAGLTIAGLATHVPAVDSTPLGIGGDSLVELAGDGLSIGPQRVTPLCRMPLLGFDLPHPRQWLAPGPGRLLALPQTEVSCPPATPPHEHTTTALRLWDWLILHGPSPWGIMRRQLDLPEARLAAALAWLEAHGLAVVTGLTPTDCLHALGHLDLWDQGVAQAGLKSAAQATGTSPEDLGQRILETTHQRITAGVLHALGMRQGGSHLAAALTQGAGPYLQITARLRLPIIGMGAAAAHFLPPVAAALGTELFLAKHYASGNAIGAALLALHHIQGE